MPQQVARQAPRPVDRTTLRQIVRQAPRPVDRTMPQQVARQAPRPMGRTMLRQVAWPVRQQAIQPVSQPSMPDRPPPAFRPLSIRCSLPAGYKRKAACILLQAASIESLSGRTSLSAPFFRLPGLLSPPRVVGTSGFEPLTSCLSSRRSKPTELCSRDKKTTCIAVSGESCSGS